ncbi:hypothetical protein ACKI1J_29460 [Streptomyces scabiei]
MTRSTPARAAAAVPAAMTPMVAAAVMTAVLGWMWRTASRTRPSRA